ncbi:hypothetical protein GCM10023340_40790 [Nocardioides marinquilinus]|uniref:Glycosyltransferase RgtA/B/C/D-like domain-containing protein n=1 Tax=Nocardioides marinquilinus TaxID=1210400 RepID=A0ABP9Q1X6_9ACTN
MTTSAPPRTERARRWWDDLERPERVLVGLGVAVLALRGLVYLGTADGILIGDEYYYLDAGRAFSNVVRDLVTLRGPDLGELDAAVVGSGWFMPGMSVVLAPLYLVAPGAPVPVVRAFAMIVSTLLLLATVLKVRRTFGNAPAGALLVFPGLVPTYAAFGAATWGDSAAGLVAVLMLCHAVTMLREVREHRTISWRAGLLLGLYAIVAVYLRSSVAVFVVGVLGVTFVTSLLLAARAERIKVVLGYVVAGVVFVGLLAPWSLAASLVLDAPVLTTVSVPTVRANTFGDPDAVCLGECDLGSNIWFSPLRYSREHARATGLSEVEIADEMSAYARRDVTATSYARDVVDNTMRYFSEPARFATLLRWSHAPYDIVPLAEVGTNALFYPSVLVLVGVLAAVARRGFDQQLQLVLLKVGVLTLLVQPFVHIAGPRYWTTMAPMLGLGAALLWQLWRDRADDVPRSTGWVARWLTLAQVVLTAVAAGAVVVIGTLALL